MERTAESLDPWFVTGLVEGEGCFTVSFAFRRRLKIGVETRPSFSISLNERDLPLIQSIHRFFNCGAVRFSRNDRTYKYESRSVTDLVTRVIPHFAKFPLKGSKAKDFEVFADICRKVRANQHLNRDSLKKIIEDAYRMNPSGKRRHDRNDLLRRLGKLKV